MHFVRDPHRTAIGWIAVTSRPAKLNVDGRFLVLMLTTQRPCRGMLCASVFVVMQAQADPDHTGYTPAEIRMLPRDGRRNPEDVAALPMRYQFAVQSVHTGGNVVTQVLRMHESRCWFVHVVSSNVSKSLWSNIVVHPAFDLAEVLVVR